MLNQTNIGANNNKFYVIQVLTKGGKHYAWTRWGRVGEEGQHALVGPTTADAAIKAFKSKFHDKTSNDWDKRAQFKEHSGRYTLIEVDRSADASKTAELEAKLKNIDAGAAKIQKAEQKKFKPSALSEPVQDFLKLIFDKDMFTGAMASFDIDVNKMPLGALSSSQVKRGYEVLEALGKAIEGKKKANIIKETSHFYTVIPHAFGRRTPPVIDSQDLLAKKIEMLNVLSDIELAVTLEKSQSDHPTDEKLAPHPADQNYKKLGATIEHVDPKSDEFEFVQKYLEATASSYNKPKIIGVYRMDRNGEGSRYAEHDKLDNRKLLWHGTNVAVVAAICKSGLRIMPHSGGRVGKGIYLASENGKSIGYVGWASGGRGVMFLAEAVLGKEHSITNDNHSLKAAPKGYHSIIARGHTEPDPKHDIVRKFDGRDVVIPQGKPTTQKQYGKSSFSQTEYLVYNESQVRLRYAIHVKSA
jgi:poly [ADP-ribose] polymerase